MKLELANGTPLLVRPIRPEDKELLQDGLRHLSDASVRARFLTPKSRFSAAELRYLTEVDGYDHVALMAVHAERPQLLGVARYVRLEADPQAAEFAIVVGDDHQGQGLGTLLAELLADEARARDVRRFTATVLSENRAVRRIIESITSRLDAKRLGGIDELVGEIAA